MTERWQLPEYDAQMDVRARNLADHLSLPVAVARLLACRGLTSVPAAETWLHPTLSQMHGPLTMLGMDKAVARLRTAIMLAQPILIYGDYDVDGTIATVILKTGIERAAAALSTAADVRFHIPHRIREGYGMQQSRIVAAAAEGVRLVVSVDTGIRGFAAAEEAQRAGVDLIVTDHHLPDERGVPAAVAVLNPNQAGCPYPYKELCGAAVAFKLAQALVESTLTTDTDRDRWRTKTLRSFVKLLSIATIADAVPLTGENRVIASVGLAELRRPAQAGLRALMELAQINASRPVQAMDVGFRLAPRINAAGRMDIASDVVELFLTRDETRAKDLAAKLHRLNEERRATEALALKAIEHYLDGLTDLPACMVLDDAGSADPWHRGVVGILASRVVDRTARPALVLTHEEGEAYGSGRSVQGFHLLDALTDAHTLTADPLFTRFGGHAHAVGFSLPSSKVDELRVRLDNHAADRIRVERVPTLNCDAEVRLGELTSSFFRAFEAMEPFGQGNPEPVFISRCVRLTAPPRAVSDKHVRLQVEDPADGTRFSGMAWGRRCNWQETALAGCWQQGTQLDLAYRLRRNWHPDFGGWEMEIVAASLPGNAAHLQNPATERA